MSHLPIDGLLDVTCEYDVEQVLPDGTRLSADVYRPVGGGRHPVLLQRLPYNKTTAENLCYQHPIWYARRGYMVVIQDVRGRWKSGGDFYPFAHEEADGAEAVEWAARLPGANGKVGMYGYSYPGATQLLAARARPPSLKAIAPGMTASQYHDSWTYQGGAFSLAFALSWATELIGDQALRRGDDACKRDIMEATSCGRQVYHLPLKEMPFLRGKPESQFFFDWLDHPANDAYWQRWSLESSYPQLQIPTLHFGGWYDVFLRGTIRNFQGMKSAGAPNQQLLIAPWIHMPWAQQVGCLDFGPDAVNSMDQRQLAFFDHFLKEESLREEPEPVEVFMIGENRWRRFASWPPPQAQPRSLFLHSKGSANLTPSDGSLSPEPPTSEPPDVYIYTPFYPVLSAGGSSCCFPAVAPMGPADQRGVEADPGVLVYTSAPMPKDCTIAGPVKLRLWAVSTARDTDFTAKLCRVDRGGTSINLCSGIIRARYRNSLTEASLLEPGRAYEYEIDLGATAVRLTAGECLRVLVSSSDFPHWDRNLNTGGEFGTEQLSQAIVATQLILHEERYQSRLEYLEVIE
jgi:putative CocE/NonD family hydrolase